MFGPVRGRWKDGCRCGLRGWPPDGGAQRVFRERAAVECRAPAAEADVRHLRGGGCRVADRGLGPVCSWSRQGVGMSGVGRCAADRRCRVVGQQGGCRAGVGPVRAGADRWARRGPAWTLCSGEAGMEPLPFPNGAGRIPRTEPLFRRGASLPAGPASGRCGPLGATRVGVDPLFRRGRSHLRTGRCRFRTGRSHPPDARPPIFARSALRKGPDAPFSDSFCPFLQRPAAPEPTPFANPRFRRSGKAKKLFFYFYFIIKDVSLCSQNNT